MTSQEPLHPCDAAIAADTAHVDQIEAEGLDPHTTPERRDQIIDELLREAAVATVALAHLMARRHA